MSTSLADLRVEDGDPVGTDHIAIALTAGELVYDDDATQRFEPGGATTYVDHGRPTIGTWYLDDEGHFYSFWPPTYRARYDLRWIVADGTIVGLRFIDVDRGSRFDGRYR